MQFRLRTLFILTAIVCVYFGVLNAPPFIAIPLYCAIVWLTPAYWIAGVIYAREARRAFFVGGLAAGTLPFFILIYYSLNVVFDGWGPWGYRNYGGRGFYGEYQLMNLVASLFIFAPVVLAIVGGWISWAVYYGVQPPRPVSPPTSPFLQTFPKASPPAGESPVQAFVSTSGSAAPRQLPPGSAQS